MKSIFTVLIICGLYNVSHCQSKDRKYYADMSNALGFAYGIELNNQYIQEFLPELAAKAKLAQGDFIMAHGESIESIENELATFQDITPATIKTQYTNPIINQIEPNSLTQKESSKYLENFNDEVIMGRKEVFTPFVKTLLRNNPSYRKTPAKEFLNNYREIFYSNGHSKSSGVNLSIEYPTSWISEPGIKSNLLQKFKTDNNLCIAGITIQNRSIETNNHSSNMTKEELEYILSMDYTNELVKEYFALELGRKNIDEVRLKNINDFNYEHTVIDGQSTMIMETTGEIQNEYHESRVYISFYHIVYKNHLITLSYMINSAIGDLDSEIEKYKPLYQLMASSLKFTD